MHMHRCVCQTTGRPGVDPALHADYLMLMPLEEDNLHDALHERGWRPSTEQLLDLALRLADACAHVHSKGDQSCCAVPRTQRIMSVEAHASEDMSLMTCISGL